MAKRRSPSTQAAGTPAGRQPKSSGPALALTVAIVLLVGGALAWALFSPPVNPPGGSAKRPPTPPPPAANPPRNPAAPPAELPRMEANQAVMVTVELDFGGPPPTIAEALREIERRHQADDGGGRVFAILDAYGGPTADGKKLHMSMHLSTEKPGIGSLIFKRTGETLWANRIVPATNANRAFAGGSLTILLDNGDGRVFTVDGSSNPSTIIEAMLKEPGLPVREAWPDGVEREVTFIYSACGCPVKVLCRRNGDRTVRTKDMPVIFPDDPSAVTVITRLMGW